LGVPRLTFMGVLGALVDRGRPQEEVFQVFRPGFDLDRERAARIAAGKASRLDPGDLYAHVRCYRSLCLTPPFEGEGMWTW